MNYFVYFVSWSCIENSPIKIGVSNDVSKRIDSLQTGSPYLIRKLHVFEFAGRKSAYDFEAYCHKKLGFYNMMGEWFQPADWSPESLMRGYIEGDVFAVPVDSIKYALFPTFHTYFIMEDRLERLRCKLDRKRKNRKIAKKNKHDLQTMDDFRPVIETVETNAQESAEKVETNAQESEWFLN